VVAGCLTQRYAEVLQAEMPEVDYFVGTSAYPRIASILRGERDRAVIPDPDYIADAMTPRRNSMPRWTAYVKISEGCDNRCTFCIIPTLRGLQRSRPIADIVTEAQRLVKEGAVELNLVAQDLTAYGHDLPGRPRLHELLQALGDVPAQWIRLHYAYPRDFPDALIDAIGKQPNLARYLDMPLQHIADPVLRRMKRGRDAAWVKKLVRKLRDRVPDLTFRTSFIVGFPGETDSDFQELCDFVEEMRFDKVGVFQFSREEGTPSFDLDGQLSQRVKATRQKKLLGLQRKISKEHQQKLVGRTRRAGRRRLRRDRAAARRPLDGAGAGDRRQGLCQPRPGARGPDRPGRDRAGGRLRPGRRNRRRRRTGGANRRCHEGRRAAGAARSADAAAALSHPLALRTAAPISRAR